jgi:RecA-family ATPase
MKRVKEEKPPDTKYVPAPKINQCLADLPYRAPASHIFDEFWRDGELALLFGASGVGKSIFAVQLAEAIARGTKIGNFRMSATRQKCYTSI